MDANWSSFIFQLGLQTPPQVPPPAEPLQVELLPVLSTVSAAQESAAAAAAVAAIASSGGPGSASNGGGGSQASTVDTAALKQGLPGNVGQDGQLDVRKVSKSKGPYICALCSKEFKNGYNLRRHEAIHTGVKPRSAATTTNKMPTMVPLSLLSVAAAVPLHNAMGASSGGGVVASVTQPISEGDGVGLVTTTASGKRIRKNHACEMCGKAFRDVYHLNRHKLSHSDEKPYECPICQQRFKRKDRMSYHVRSHDGTIHKPYICSHCGKGFSRPDHLNSHVRQVHSSERPFKCPSCQAAFATKDRLRAHMVRHEEKVPCHICGKLLSAAYITDHMKVHSEGPAHVCDLCNKGTGEVCPMALAAAAAAAASTAAVTVIPMEGAPVVTQALPSQPW
ncbi:myc-associated zinc finger protein isoform X2 [Ambystoma mexicanum]|uniref:myc-associated zinc finger protein isoform X2 n=1 Tax=Ambystoma mexicanum TaxID=8296 RepID=UPI0037E6FBDB